MVVDDEASVTAINGCRLKETWAKRVIDGWIKGGKSYYELECAEGEGKPGPRWNRARA